MSEKKETPVPTSESDETRKPTDETEANQVTKPQPVEEHAAETLEELRKEKEQYHDLYLRKQAEFENFKRRIEREKAESIKYANELLICELLPVIDNFELAITAAEKEKDSHSHYEGVKLILKQLKDVLSKFDLTDVPAVDEPFDPAYHEAVLQVPTDDHPHNTVVQEHRKGYKLKGKLIRPSMVVVSKKEEKTETVKKTNY